MDCWYATTQGFAAYRQRLSKFVAKKKETISAVIEEKAIKGSLALSIATLVLYVT
jgi:hypothetical protein